MAGAPVLAEPIDPVSSDPLDFAVDVFFLYQEAFQSPFFYDPKFNGYDGNRIHSFLVDRLSQTYPSLIVSDDSPLVRMHGSGDAKIRRLLNPLYRFLAFELNAFSSRAYIGDAPFSVCVAGAYRGVPVKQVRRGGVFYDPQSDPGLDALLDSALESFSSSENFPCFLSIYEDRQFDRDAKI